MCTVLAARCQDLNKSNMNKPRKQNKQKQNKLSITTRMGRFFSTFTFCLKVPVFFFLLKSALLSNKVHSNLASFILKVQKSRVQHRKRNDTKKCICLVHQNCASSATKCANIPATIQNNQRLRSDFISNKRLQLLQVSSWYMC